MAAPDLFLRTAMDLPLARRAVFDFFARAENLEAITPPELRFEIVSPLPVRMGAGARIDYRLRLWGVPLSWKTVISTWDPPFCFVDQQLAGPYAVWVHTHRFSEVDGGTRIEDEVRYRLPLWPLGQVARPLVRHQLARIFAFRQRRVRQLLAGP